MSGSAEGPVENVTDYQVLVHGLGKHLGVGDQEGWMGSGNLRTAFTLLRSVPAIRDQVFGALRACCLNEMRNEQGEQHGGGQKGRGDQGGRGHRQGGQGGKRGNFEGGGKRSRRDADEPSMDTGISDTQLIRDSLVSLLSELPHAWAPHTMQWALDLLRDYRVPRDKEKDLSSLLSDCDSSPTLHAVLTVLLAALEEIDDLGLDECLTSIRPKLGGVKEDEYPTQCMDPSTCLLKFLLVTIGTPSWWVAGWVCLNWRSLTGALHTLHFLNRSLLQKDPNSLDCARIIEHLSSKQASMSTQVISDMQQQYTADTLAGGQKAESAAAQLSYMLQTAAMCPSLLKASIMQVVTSLTPDLVARVYTAACQAGQQSCMAGLTRLFHYHLDALSPASFSLVRLLDSLQHTTLPEQLQVHVDTLTSLLLLKVVEVVDSRLAPFPLFAQADKDGLTSSPFIQSLIPHAISLCRMSLEYHLFQLSPPSTKTTTTHPPPAAQPPTRTRTRIYLPHELVRLVATSADIGTAAQVLATCIMSVGRVGGIERAENELVRALSMGLELFLDLLQTVECAHVDVYRTTLDLILSRVDSCSQYDLSCMLRCLRTLLDLDAARGQGEGRKTRDIVAEYWFRLFRRVYSLRSPAITQLAQSILVQTIPRAQWKDGPEELDYAVGLIAPFYELLHERTALLLGNGRGQIEGDIAILSDMVDFIFAVVRAAVSVHKEHQSVRAMLLDRSYAYAMADDHRPLCHPDSLAVGLTAKDSMHVDEVSSQVSLLESNQGKGMRWRWQFHVGAVGALNRQPTFLSLQTERQALIMSCVAYNERAIRDLLWCCIPPDGSASLLLAKGLGKQMRNQLASQDPMVTNEDYKRLLPKVTPFPRDRHIRKWFETHPILWSILEILAEEPDSLLLVQVEVRSMLATVIGEFHRGLKQQTTALPQTLRNANRLMDILAKAQWLPMPLCSLGEILEHVSCEDATKVLMPVWDFLAAYPPEPWDQAHVEKRNRKRLFPVGCALPYLGPLKAVVRRNMGKVGSFYVNFFPSDPTSMRELQATPKLF